MSEEHSGVVGTWQNDSEMRPQMDSVDYQVGIEKPSISQSHHDSLPSQEDNASSSSELYPDMPDSIQLQGI